MAVYTTIDDPEAYFQAKLYSGNSDADDAGAGTTNALTLDGDTDMQPDFLWLKRRDGADSNHLFDAVRGVTKGIYSNNNSAEDTLANSLSSFNSDGFTLGNDTGTGGATNKSGETYVAWCWKESATAGFDIVSFTGNVTNRTISHSLSAVPHLMIIKNREATESWVVYHASNTSAPETDYLILNANNATADGNTTWNDTAPTSSVFTVSTSPAVNGDGEGMIMYLWSEKQGFSKFGSYTGNGNADGTFVYLGFKPAFMLAKRTDSTDHWTLWDNKRESNPNNNVLYPSLNDAESTGDSSYPADLVSNGVKWRGTSTGMNASGANYVYMAFAEAPFVNSNGVPNDAK